MALLGQAALAMWWDVAPKVNAEFQDWHSHEHFRERLAIPGFKRATRWSSADGGEGVFQIYEMQAHEVRQHRAPSGRRGETGVLRHVRVDCHLGNPDARHGKFN